ncbi:MAG: NAD(P)-binding protein [Rhodopila sp.]
MTDVQSVYQRGLDGPPMGPNLRGTKKIAIIGAGASGLCSAKYLLQAGFDVTIFEIGSQIGGMWCYRNDSGRSSAYRTLHINTSRGVTRFSDLDFDPDTQPFPDHYDMHRYLVQYADHFGVTPRIRFNSKVVQVRPAFDPARCTRRTCNVSVRAICTPMTTGNRNRSSASGSASSASATAPATLPATSA